MNATDNKPKSEKAILLTKACDLTAFASTDESRYVLNGVHYNAAQKRVEATNGRFCIHAPVMEVDGAEFPDVSSQQPNTPSDCIIPGDLVKKAINQAPRGVTLPILKCVKLDTNGASAALASTDLASEKIVASKTTEGAYPNIDQVYPNASQKPVFQINLHPDYLLTIAKYAKKCRKKDTGMLLEFFASNNDDPGPMRFTVTLEDGKAVGMLMPMRSE